MEVEATVEATVKWLVANNCRGGGCFGGGSSCRRQLAEVMVYQVVCAND